MKVIIIFRWDKAILRGGYKMPNEVPENKNILMYTCN